MFRSLEPPRINKPFMVNQLVQIDFIGPMNVPFPQKYACTMIDVRTGIVSATASSHPDAKTTERAIVEWLQYYGPPQVIESDQGTHFTATAVQKLAAEYDIDWQFHLAYNPTAAGNIERANALIKQKLQTLLMDRKFSNLQTALSKACILLNSRPRQNRLAPFEELYLPHLRDADQYEFIPPPRQNKKVPYKILTKDIKEGILSQQEIIADSGANLFWTVTDKGKLQQTKLQNTQPSY